MNLLILKTMKGKKIISWLGSMNSLALGIYIIHPMVIEILDNFRIISLLFNPIFSVPLLSLIIFSISGMIVYFL